MAIQFLRGLNSQIIGGSAQLKAGQPVYATDANKLYVASADGDRVSQLTPIGDHLLTQTLNSWTGEQRVSGAVRILTTGSLLNQGATELWGQVIVRTSLSVGSDLTVTGNLKKGTCTYTLPSITGTLALTSNISHLYRHVLGCVSPATGQGWYMAYYDTSSDILTLAEYLDYHYGEDTYTILPMHGNIAVQTSPSTTNHFSIGIAWASNSSTVTIMEAGTTATHAFSIATLTDEGIPIAFTEQIS